MISFAADYGDLFRRAGIRRKTLNRIKSGQRPPSAATVEKLDP